MNQAHRNNLYHHLTMLSIPTEIVGVILFLSMVMKTLLLSYMLQILRTLINEINPEGSQMENFSLIQILFSI